jgi:hypothetical protein
MAENKINNGEARTVYLYSCVNALLALEVFDDQSEVGFSNLFVLTPSIPINRCM